jgi:hypothetical protein
MYRVVVERAGMYKIEIPPAPPLFQRRGMFCCFRKLAGMQPKIASEYLPLYQTPNTSTFTKPRTPPSLPNSKHLPLSPNPKHLPLCQTPNTSPFRQTPNISPLTKGGRGDFHSRRGLQTMLPYHPGRKPSARVLRRTMTDAERLLWSRVRSTSRSGRFRSIVRNRLAATSLIFTHPKRSW